MSVGMAQARLYWDRKNYVQVEKLLRASVEFCSDESAWKSNMANALFMQEKYQEAVSLYEGHSRITSILLLSFRIYLLLLLLYDFF